MKQQYLVNVDKKSIRVAVLEDGELVQLFIEQDDARAILGNIYKAVVSDVKPGIHAIFVDIGRGRNAFLHFDDVVQSTAEFSQGRTTRGHGSKPSKREPAKHASRNGKDSDFDPAKALRPGDPLMVQVTKEGIGQKGPRVSTHVSLPGRYLVLLPFAGKEGGISRKIEDFQERRRLRRILREIHSDEKAYIVRTAGLEQPAEDIKSDVGFLDRTWRSIGQKYRKATGPELVYSDHDILYRIVRDVISSSADEIWIDSRPEFRQIQRLVRQMIPSVAEKVLHYSDPLKTVFNQFEVEKQIQKALRRRVWLRSGGYLIFDEMEAMTAIDVNTGKYTGGRDQDRTVYRTNLEAARTIAHQLRLRDIGGLIVIDFIDMESRQYQKNLMAEFKRLVKRDKAKSTVLNLSEFGLVEMTRKRVRHSLKGFFFTDCPCCGGSGQVLTPEQIWRNIRREVIARLATPPRPYLDIVLHSKQKTYIETEHAVLLRKWQARYRIEIRLIGDDSVSPEYYEFREIDRPSVREGQVVPVAVVSSSPRRRSRRRAARTAPATPEPKKAESRTGS